MLTLRTNPVAYTPLPSQAPALYRHSAPESVLAPPTLHLVWDTRLGEGSPPGCQLEFESVSSRVTQVQDKKYVEALIAPLRSKLQSLQTPSKHYVTPSISFLAWIGRGVHERVETRTVHARQRRKTAP